MEQNREPKITLYIYSQLTFNKGTNNTQWGKISLLNKCCWDNWIATCRRIPLDSYGRYKNQLKID